MNGLLLLTNMCLTMLKDCQIDITSTLNLVKVIDRQHNAEVI